MVGPHSLVKGVIQSHGELFQRDRQGEITKVRGFATHEQASGKPYISFMPDEDVKAGDKLTGETSKNVCYVIDAPTDVMFKKPVQIKAFYESEAVHQQRISTRSHSNNINIGTAINSPVQANSPYSTQTVIFSQTQKTEIHQIASNLRSALDKLGLDDAERADLEQDVAGLESQLTKSKPSTSVIRGCLESAKTVLEKVASEAATGAATAVALELLHQIAPYLTGG